jgi:hypothetical protein
MYMYCSCHAAPVVDSRDEVERSYHLAAVVSEAEGLAEGPAGLQARFDCGWGHIRVAG